MSTGNISRRLERLSRPNTLRTTISRNSAPGPTPATVKSDTPNAARQRLNISIAFDTLPPPIGLPVASTSNSDVSEIQMREESPEFEMSDLRRELVNARTVPVYADAKRDNFEDETPEHLFDNIEPHVDEEDLVDVEDDSHQEGDIDPQIVSNQLLSEYLPHLMTQECPESPIPRCHGSLCQMKQSNELEQLLYRCQDCFGDHLLCGPCLVDLHRLLPFHRIQSWGPTKFFQKADLFHAGLIFRLGHHGAKCQHTGVSGIGSHALLKILDLQRIHLIKVEYCQCPGAAPYHIQLFNNHIFPATRKAPATGYTFRLLQHFQQFNLTTKSSPYDYHQTLQYLTSAASPKSAGNLYSNFVKVARQWRVLRMMKRAGRMDNNCIQPGELTVECPACPHPGVNLPSGWENEPPR
ncbi:hypothetical protein FRC02_005039 [Tulasnella sp. 418]|nr:hypothetical protein FRC02_005039 [Tulasnella sp. 418]